MATNKPLTDFAPLAVGNVQQDDILFVVDVHDTSQSSAGSTKTLALSALFGSMVNAILSGVLTFSAAVSKLIPGATSFSIRNHADSADNLLVSDAGDVTPRRHYLATGSAPTVAKFAGAATFTVTAASGSTDTRGQLVIVVTGTGSWRVIVTFAAPFLAIPFPNVTTSLGNAGIGHEFATGHVDSLEATTTEFYIVGPDFSATGTYYINYVVIG